MDHPGIPTLTTPRLVLRPFVPSDLDELAVDPCRGVVLVVPAAGGMTKEETAGFLERVTARYESDGFGIEALIDRASGAMIGWAGLAVPHFLPEILPAVEVGWRLAGAWRGRGLATEAGAAAVDFGFTDGRPRPDRQHLRAGERGVRARHGASWLHPLAHHDGPARRGDRGDRADREQLGGRASDRG